MDKVESFIKEYEVLCRKFDLYIDVTEVFDLGIFTISKDNNEADFETILSVWRNP